MSASVPDGSTRSITICASSSNRTIRQPFDRLSLVTGAGATAALIFLANASLLQRGEKGIHRLPQLQGAGLPRPNCIFE
jgi:hypothetical protein